MRTKLLVVLGIAVAGYVLGTRANRPVLEPRESVRHQVERLWNDPKARKRREQRIAEIQRDGKKSAKRLAKQAKRRTKALGR